MRLIRKSLASSFLAVMAGACLTALAQQPPAPATNPLIPPAPHAKQIHLKHVLVIGQTKGFEHDSVPDAMAAIYNMGHETGLWDTTMRTDTELLTKKDLGQERQEPELLRSDRLRQHHRRARSGRQPEGGHASRSSTKTARASSAFTPRSIPITTGRSMAR